jgi:hypothetical protein
MRGSGPSSGEAFTIGLVSFVGVGLVGFILVAAIAGVRGGGSGGEIGVWVIIGLIYLVAKSNIKRQREEDRFR